MKKLSILIAALLSVVSIWSQAPVNDDCSGLIDLGYAPTCPPDTFTNINATASNIGFDNNPTCFNGNLASHDVWFMFTCPDTAFDFRITLTGVTANSIVNPEFAIYRGDCQVDGLAELLCGIADIGENSLYLDVIGLTPGLPYFIRVSDYSQTGSPNWGNFTLCVTEVPPNSNIDDGGSTLCAGTLYDTGGPDGDYGPNEDNVFVICPTEPSACITFTMQYYNFDAGDFFGSDVMSFYDGDNTNAPLLAQMSGDGGFGGDNLVAGGGGVCFQVQATSGCLTVQFQSDDVVEFEGFQGSWECSQQACPQPEVMNVELNITPEEIVNAVSTPATTVTITNIECPQIAYGTFNFPTDDNQLGLQKGLILTSGAGDLAIGPNMSPSTTGNNNGDGDADLDYLSVQQGNGQMSHDACVVELDVFVATDQMTFEYIFGSDEYPEYVNSSFNDIFAFLVSGPGVVGDPGIGNQLNIATIPGSNDPVQINSVNNLLNWEYYRNNQIGQAIEYDGLTSDFLGVKKSLTAQVDVIPCNTYHLKLAVADRGDWSFDSGVFVSDIKGGTPDIKVNFASGIDYFVEDCSGTQDQLVINLSEPAEELTNITVNISGTATLGLDYVLNIPSVLTFLPGQQQQTFPIFPLADGLVEGTETIVISLSNNFGCGNVIYKTIEVYIEDNVVVSVNTGSDTLLVCAGATLQLEAHGAVNYFWTPPGIVSNPFIDNPTITPTQDVWLSVLGTVGVLPACFDIDSVYVHIVDPQISVTSTGTTNICQGASVQLFANNNVSNSGMVWSPVAGLDNPGLQNPIATPSVTTTYTAKVSIAGCSVTDQITINVDTMFFPVINVADTTICQNYSVQLANELNTTTEYQWSPAIGLSDAGVSGPLATPDQSTLYTLTATSANGYCVQTATVDVTVIAADVDIIGETYTEICLGDTVQLSAEFGPTSPGAVQWSPSFYVSNPTGPNTVAAPDESVTIYATYNVNGCVVRDSVHIRVDSIPLSDIIRVEDKAVYCVGDTVYLISKTYEPASFPDIDLAWTPMGNQLTPLENWNMVIIASETLTFERVLNNRGCTDTSTVVVNVAVPPTFTISADPDVLCPGEPTQLNATVTPSQTLEWMDETGTLSCTDCPNPIATPFVTTTYTVSAPDAPCPAGASVTILVTPPPALLMAQSQVICPGEIVVLNLANEAGVNYSWTSEPAGFVSTEPSPAVSPTVTTKYKVVADNGSCTSTSELTLTPVAATVNIGPDQTVCQNDLPITLHSNPTGTPGTYFWRPDGQMTQDVQVSPDETTEYVVTLAYGDDCVTTDTMVLSVLPAPNIDVANDTSICRGNPVLLNKITDPGVTYSWTSDPPGFNSTDAMPIESPQDTTTYFLVASNSVCDVFDTVTVAVSFATVSAGPDQSVCINGTATLTATVTGTPGTFLWIPGNLTTAAIQVQPDKDTTYTVTLSYGNGCLAADQVAIDVLTEVSVDPIVAVPDSSNLCEGAVLTLSVVVDPPTSTMVWTANGVEIPDQNGTEISIVPDVPAGTEVTYDVVATDANGCTGSPAPYTVTIDRCYLIPTAFTPDGDGTNDTFGLALKGGEIEVKNFSIYNRWGEEVFESTTGNTRWDGKFNGNPATSDVYIYVMVLKFPDGTEKTLKGDVTLIR